jgi:hypothetical protein
MSGLFYGFHVIIKEMYNINVLNGWVAEWTLKLRKACGLDGIPNESIRQFPLRALVHMKYSITALKENKPYNATECR